MRGLRSIAIAIVLGATGLAGSSSPDGLSAHRATSEDMAAHPKLVGRDMVDGGRRASEGPLGHRWIALDGTVGVRLD